MRKIIVILLAILLAGIMVKTANSQHIITDENLSSDELFILSRSSCDPSITDSLKGISESKDSDSIFYLSNGQIWQEYSKFNDHIVRKTSTLYRYRYYKDKPGVTIYKENGNLACKLKINGSSGESYVYRVYR